MNTNLQIICAVGLGIVFFIILVCLFGALALTIEEIRQQKGKERWKL